MHSDQHQPQRIVAIKVHQWLKEWDRVAVDKNSHRRLPQPYFYLFTLPASELKALSGVHPRSTENAQLRSQDLGIQRRHDRKRSEEISTFIQFGYPWSSLSSKQRESEKFSDLRKPGWLPTAIIVNILEENDVRRGRHVDSNDLVTVNDLDNRSATIRLPNSFNGPEWKPAGLHPLEVIDGQHRLWAFDEEGVEGDFELPVVAFYGLDISWQAYLFWTINIKPKRINASLAFDVYPLLRTEDWLEKFEGPAIYRETRAQELVESLWAYPESPWYQRINMLGESGLGQMVTQAAWIKSLTATYVRAWEGRGVKGSIGGLFGAPIGSDEEVLPWSRSQQAAFLIFVWQCIGSAVTNCREPWAESLRSGKQHSSLKEDPAFAGSYDTHLNTNIGTRGILHITNDFCYLKSEELGLRNWVADDEVGTPDDEAIRRALESLAIQEVATFLRDLAVALVEYDWRTSSAPGLSRDEQRLKAAIRGGAGYKELRVQLLEHLANTSGHIGQAAQEVINALGY